MKPPPRRFVSNGMILIALVFAITYTVLRFKNPDMTDTRPLIVYWRDWAVFAALFVVEAGLVWLRR